MENNPQIRIIKSAADELSTNLQSRNNRVIRALKAIQHVLINEPDAVEAADRGEVMVAALLKEIEALPPTERGAS